MAVMQIVPFTDPHLTPDHAGYWFLMQLRMALGFLTAVPVNLCWDTSGLASMHPQLRMHAATHGAPAAARPP